MLSKPLQPLASLLNGLPFSTAWALCLIPVLLCISCGRSPVGPPPRPNVLLIISDTLRADVLDCYGGQARTPNLCRLAERGVLFENNFANAPWTLPSSVALFTGNYPNQYRRLIQKPKKEGRRGESFFLVQEEEHLLVEALRDEGYDAESWIENGIARQANATQGFTSRDGEKIDREILPTLTEQIAFQPLDPRYLDLAWSLDYLLHPPQNNFFLLHWIKDPHAEYRPPSLFRKRDGLTMEGYPRDPQFYLGLGHSHSPKKNRHKLRQVAPTLNARELALVEKLYVLEVESMDERVGCLLKALEVGGTADNTLVIFTSDHGEGFGEHGRFLHGDSLYNELVRVPLIIAGPGVVAGRRETSPVSHVDLVPTLADLLGVQGFDDLQGTSLRGLLARERAADRRRLHYLASPDRLDRDGLILGSYKLIAGLEDNLEDNLENNLENKSVELYDLSIDPGEQLDLAQDLPEIVAEMKGHLARIRQDIDHKWKIRLSLDHAEVLSKTERETREQLRAVGYID